MLETIIEQIVSANGVLGAVVGLLVYALKVERDEKKQAHVQADAVRAELLNEAKATVGLMRDLEAAILAIQRDQETRLLHRDRLERVMDRIEKKL